MWLYFNTYSVKLILNKYLDEFVFNSIHYLNIDSGISWKFQNWEWCSLNELEIKNYVANLWDQKILPIFYATKISLDAYNQLINNFLETHPGLLPICFYNIELVNLHSMISNEWINGKFNQNYFSCKFIPSPKFYSTGSSLIGENISIDSLKFTQYDFEDLNSQVLILIGPPKSGKTQLSHKLKKSGWLHITQYQQNLICKLYFRNSTKIDKYLDLFKKMNEYKFVGIVIDGDNYLKENQQVFIDICQKYNLSFKFGLLTRTYEDQRSIKTIRMLSTIFFKRLTLPEYDCVRIT